MTDNSTAVYAPRYALFGALLGLLVPLFGSMLAALLQTGTITLNGMWQALVSNPLLWLMATSPLVLGAIAWLAGRNQDKLEHLLAHTDRLVEQRTGQLNRALTSIQSLHQIAGLLTAASELPDVLQALVGKIAEFLPADRVTLITFDLEKKQVIHFVRGGPGIENVVLTVPFEELWAGLSGWVLQNDRPALSPKDKP
ncbi:MAG: hypothetical protein D6768_03000, partial [Chloroflexi bacterium]